MPVKAPKLAHQDYKPLPAHRLTAKVVDLITDEEREAVYRFRQSLKK